MSESNLAIRLFNGPEDLAAGAADEFAALAVEAVREQGVFRVALSGGSTPRLLYQCLAGDAGARIPWAAVEVFFGDERQAPPNHADSNYRMARAALLAHVPLRTGAVHRIRGEALEASTAAAEYEETLRAAFALAPGGVPRFDLVLLGLGADGHVASLFPGSEALDVRERLVAAPFVTPSSAHRLTLTFPVINAAAVVMILVSGAGKADAVRRVLEADESVQDVPACGVQPTDGRVLWLLDTPAACALDADTLAELLDRSA